MTSKPFVLVSVGPDGSTDICGAYGSKSAAARQLNRNLRAAAQFPDHIVYHRNEGWRASSIGYRIEAAKGAQ